MVNEVDNTAKMSTVAPAKSSVFESLDKIMDLRGQLTLRVSSLRDRLIPITKGNRAVELTQGEKLESVSISNLGAQVIEIEDYLVSTIQELKEIEDGLDI